MCCCYINVKTYICICMFCHTSKCWTLHRILLYVYLPLHIYIYICRCVCVCVCVCVSAYVCVEGMSWVIPLLSPYCVRVFVHLCAPAQKDVSVQQPTLTSESLHGIPDHSLSCSFWPPQLEAGGTVLACVALRTLTSRCWCCYYCCSHVHTQTHTDYATIASTADWPDCGMRPTCRHRSESNAFTPLHDKDAVVAMHCHGYTYLI